MVNEMVEIGWIGCGYKWEFRRIFIICMDFNYLNQFKSNSFQKDLLSRQLVCKVDFEIQDCFDLLSIFVPRMQIISMELGKS